MIYSNIKKLFKHFSVIFIYTAVCFLLSVIKGNVYHVSLMSVLFCSSFITDVLYKKKSQKKVCRIFTYVSLFVTTLCTLLLYLGINVPYGVNIALTSVIIVMFSMLCLPIFII